MKILKFAVVAILMSSAANASVITVVERPIAMGGGASYLTFGYDERGRAWVELKDTNGYSADADVAKFLKFPMPGLRFDLASRRILYRGAECAVVAPMGTGDSVFKTGRCELRAIVHDFGDHRPRMETVVMEVR